MNKRTRQKRVRIASDAIAQIKAKKLIPEHFGYCIPITNCNYFTQLNQALKDDNTKCKVCALGSLLVADVIKNNHLTVVEADSYGFGEINSRLANIFDTKTLMILEYLYEHTNAGALCDVLDGDYHFAGITFTDKEIALYNYYSKSLPKDPKDRLLILLQNIVRNDGEFIIPRDIVRKHEKEYKKEMASRP